MVQIVNPNITQTTAPQMFMPQYQPQQPQPSAWDNFQQQFSSSAGQGLGSGIQQGMKEQLRRSLVQKALSTLPENANTEQSYKALLQNVDPQTQAQILPLLEIKAKSQAEESKRQHEFEKIRLQNEGRLEVAQAKAKLKSKGVDLERTPEQKQMLQDSFNTLARLSSKGNLGNPYSTGGILNRERQEDIGEFDTTAVDFISILRKLENQGHITDQAFKTLLKSIPDAHDSDRKTKGKLKAIAQKLGLDASAVGVKEVSKKQGTSHMPVEPGFQRMIDPQTGDTWDIEDNKVQEALAAGWK